MTTSIFLVPSVRAEDRAVIWQLTLLGDAYGFEVNYAKRSKAIDLSNGTKRKIKDADVVIAIVTKSIGRAAECELNFAAKRKAPLLLFVEKGSTGVNHSEHPVTGKHCACRSCFVEGSPLILEFSREMNAEELGRLVARAGVAGREVGLFIMIGLGLLSLASSSEPE